MNTKPTLVLVAWLFGAACSTSDEGLGPAVCTGTGCMCAPENICACSAGVDCKTTCSPAGCTLRCEMGAKCNAASEGPTILTCQDSSECKGQGGDGSMISCTSSAKCDLKAGARSTATCNGSADCKFNLGPDSTVSCSESSRCDVKCQGNCAVTCAAQATCKMECGSDGNAGMTCPDGRRVCGPC